MVADGAAFPAATVHAVESDGPSRALARRRIELGALADRVHLRALDAADLDDRDRHDLATMNLVLHETGGPDQQHDDDPDQRGHGRPPAPTR